MNSLPVFKRGWSLLDIGEKRRALLVLFVVILSAFASAAMVGSIMPFLTVLADPSRIDEIKTLRWAYEFGGFETHYGFLVALGVTSLAVIVVANLIQILRVYLVTNFATMRMYTLSTRLLRGYLKQPYEYFLDKHSGELGSQILVEVEKMIQTFFRPAAEALASVLTIIAIVTLLVWIDPLVAAFAFIFAGGIYLCGHLLSRKMVRRFGVVRASANRSRFRVANEALSGVKDIKLLGRELYYVDSFALPSLEVATSEAKAIVVGLVPQHLMQIVAFGGMIVLILVLLDPAALDDTSTLSKLLPLLGVFAFGGQRLIPELSKLYFSFTQMTYGAPVVDALFDDFQRGQDLPPLQAPNTFSLGLHNTLEISNVTYAYPNADTCGLHDISFKIRAGERVGICGGSGSGKTTLADVMMGLLPPQSGQLLVDEIVITEDNISSWQRSVGYVQQDIFLSDSSILENIALGIPKEQIGRELAVDAARMAQLDDFISQHLPDGYDTKVGERGTRLSGGQRQRIGIARALYNNASLIVFDEATSALDNVTEKQVMDSIDALPGNMTVILIAHRLSTLKRCDRLMVLDQGRLVGVGSWSELMANNEHFKKLALAGAATITA